MCHSVSLLVCHSVRMHGSHLLQQYVPQLVNGEVAAGSRLQAAVVPQEKLCQEMGMYPDQLVQAGEHGVHGARV